MSPIARADKKARTVFGKAEKQQAHCKLLSDKPLRQRAVGWEKKKSIPGNQADNAREENSHATEIIPRETFIRRLFWIGLLNCSTAGRRPAVAQCSWVYFWDDFCAEFFFPLTQPEAQPTGVIRACPFFV